MTSDPAVTEVRIGADDIARAQGRLASRIRRTPVMRIEPHSLTTSHPGFWLKLESLQFTGAFKARGALNRILAEPVPPAGVCAASGGNHGQAVAWAARQLGVRASVFVPTTCPDIKLRRLAAYGANTTVVGDIYEQSLETARDYVIQTGAALIHSYDEKETVAGSGTAIAEFIEQVPELDTILIAVGGGGLLAGAVAALEGRPTRVIAVEPDTCRCLGAALDAGTPVDVEVSGVAVDSLGVRRIGNFGFAAANSGRVDRVEISNQVIRDAQLLAWDELRIGLEGGGATALGALLSGGYQPGREERVGILACGGNVDLAAVLAAAA